MCLIQSTFLNLDAFAAKLQKCTYYLCHACLSVCKNSEIAERIFMNTHVTLWVIEFIGVLNCSLRLYNSQQFTLRSTRVCVPGSNLETPWGSPQPGTQPKEPRWGIPMMTSPPSDSFPTQKKSYWPNTALQAINSKGVKIITLCTYFLTSSFY
jgi:hypothetical protein